jgi:hypothetical protein
MVDISKAYEETLTRSDYFRRVQVWPASDELDYKGWLANFSGDEERSLAALMLDFFMFYPKKMINYMLTKTVGYAGYALANHFADWDHKHFKDRCIYTFITGENPNPTDSGHIFVRKLRDELHIGEGRIIDFSDLHETLNAKPTPVPVILVDDFVGSGMQCVTAWNRRCPKTDLTIPDLVAMGHVFIYAPLIASLKGVTLIKKNCPDLKLSIAHTLGEEYDLFNPKCICWKNDADLFAKGTDLIIEKSRSLGIPDKGENSVKGFHEQGLALAFEHGAPDAIPAIFYWADNWTPLVKRVYNR